MCTMLDRNSISNKKQETTEIIMYYKQRLWSEGTVAGAMN